MVKTKDNVWRKRDDGTIEIELTQGQIALIDGCDLETILQYRWCAHFNGRYWYAYTGICANGKTKLLAMHRLILDAPTGMDVDHFDHQTLDNRRINIRLATRSQNNANKSKYKVGATSRHKGVHYSQLERKWKAEIKVNRQRFYLGTYTDESDAALAYNRAALEHFGAFARLNKV